MPLRPWKADDEQLVADVGIFRVQRLRTRSPRTGNARTVTRLEAPDWVNVIALTRDRRVIFVRQWRHGTAQFTLEIPGGMVDAGEEPAAAATRELLEETGYRGEGPEAVGTVTPNPAFLTNRCHTFLFTDCRRIDEPLQDPGEDLAVELHPLDDVPARIADGTIHHALVICGFWWLARHPGIPFP